VLHVGPPQETLFSLVFRRWRLQAGSLFSPLSFKVLLSIMNLPVHICLAAAVQTIIGSACLILYVALALVNKDDFSKYLVVAWVLHPDLIPKEVRCVVLEPKPPSDVG
jgi:hypothetical protein